VTTRVLLVRHGRTDAPEGQLPGPPPGPPLSQIGVEQIRRLAARIDHVALIYASPFRRAAQSAELIADTTGAPLQLEDAIAEVPFGGWAGLDVAALAGDRAWRDFNAFRTVSPITAGGLMLDVQARAIRWLAGVTPAHAGSTIVAVSHADVIRAIVAACAGVSLDLSLRLTIGVASISEIHIAPGVLRVERLNDTAHLEGLPRRGAPA
jgi:broad specificity phosphatase PhoE